MFRVAARLRPGDRAAEELTRRAEALERQPPSVDWNGVYVQASK